MFNEFVQVTDRDRKSKIMLNLNKIDYILEREDSDGIYCSIRTGEVVFQVCETFESFEEFFNENKE